MRLSAPKFIVWLIALIIAALAIVSQFVGIPVIGAFFKSNGFWAMVAAYGLLLLGTLFKGL